MQIEAHVEEDERTHNARMHCESLSAALERDDLDALLAAARSAVIAIVFRASDAPTGLDPVDPKLVSRLEALTAQVLVRAGRLGAAAAFEDLAEMHLELGEVRGDAQFDLAAAAFREGAEVFPELALVGAGCLWAAHVRVPTVYDLALSAAETDRTGEARCLLGWCAFNGIGREASLTESFALHEEAAGMGWADSMFELYALLAEGQGCEQDPEAAVAWCVRAADAGSARAMANLGGFYATGNALERDPAASLEWYGRAAEAGHGKAAATLGVMHALGQGAPADQEESKRFFGMAESAGFDWQEFASMCGVDLAGLL